MTGQTTDVFRGASYEIAEAIAPTWERRRADIEKVATPVREWMLRELRPRPGDTVLEGAGFADVRTEELGGRFVLPSVDEYLSVIADTAGPIGLALQGLSDAERADVRADVQDSFARFAAADGYDLPCVALCAVGS